MRFDYFLVFISLFFNRSSGFNIQDVSYDDFIRLFENKLIPGKYAPKRELGTGGCGKVLEATDRVRLQTVAIKFELKKCKESLLKFLVLFCRVFLSRLWQHF